MVVRHKTQCKGNTIVMLSKYNYALSLLWISPCHLHLCTCTSIFGRNLHQILCIKIIVSGETHPSSCSKKSIPLCFHFTRYFLLYFSLVCAPSLVQKQSEDTQPVFSHNPKSSDLFLILYFILNASNWKQRESSSPFPDCVSSSRRHL